MNFKCYTRNGKLISKNVLCDLYFAIGLNNVQEVERVLNVVVKQDCECDINQLTLIGNVSPLSYAIYRNSLDVIKLLLRYRCDPNRYSSDSIGRIEPPLCSAVRIGNVSIIETLLETSKEMNVNQTDFFNQTPLWLAVKARRLDIVEMIINNRNFSVDCDSFKRQKSSPVYLAAKYLNKGRYKILDVLIDVGLPLSCIEDSFEGVSVMYWVSVVHKDDYFVTKLIRAGIHASLLHLEVSKLAKVTSNSSYAYSLKNIVRVFIRNHIIQRTRKPLMVESLTSLLPQMPRILIESIVYLT